MASLFLSLEIKVVFFFLWSILYQKVHASPLSTSCIQGVTSLDADSCTVAVHMQLNESYPICQEENVPSFITLFLYYEAHSQHYTYGLCSFAVLGHFGIKRQDSGTPLCQTSSTIRLCQLCNSQPPGKSHEHLHDVGIS